MVFPVIVTDPGSPWPSASSTLATEQKNFCSIRKLWTSRSMWHEHCQSSVTEQAFAIANFCCITVWKFVNACSLMIAIARTHPNSFFGWVHTIRSWSTPPFSTLHHPTPNKLRPFVSLHLRAYWAALPTNPPECSHRVWSRNGRWGCSFFFFFLPVYILQGWPDS